jgi:DNA-3-methyladenine glycosylase
MERSFFDREVNEVARELIGVQLLVDGVGGEIVEVEAYSPDEPGSHSFRGQTLRNASMFGPPGHAYVYRSYGIHWCLNFVCGPGTFASGILIRALEPTTELDVMRARRRVDDEQLLCSGPGRLTEALGVTGAFDGLPLDAPPFALTAPPEAREIVAGPRIGLTKAVELPWRYGRAGSRFVSRRFRTA